MAVENFHPMATTEVPCRAWRRIRSIVPVASGTVEALAMDCSQGLNCCWISSPNVAMSASRTWGLVISLLTWVTAS